MTTWTSEDRINATQVYDIEDREDRERMLRDQNRILNQEIQELRAKLQHEKDRADEWQTAYHNAMDTMSKKSRGLAK